MIDCYTWMTDNGYKPRMMLEETGLAYRIIPINLREQAQMSPEFMKISPGHKIPAIVDHDGPDDATMTVFESGAILKYLAEKSGKFYPSDATIRPMAVLRLRDFYHAVATVWPLDNTFASEGAGSARVL